MNNKKPSKKSVEIYTDGSCDPNPGPGGWAALIIRNGREKMVSGSETHSTNNRMELTAAIKALKEVAPDCTVQLHTDSQYLKKGVTEWMANWKARNWKRKGGKLANVDLWKKLSKEIEDRQIEWKWVRAHAGNRLNTKVDMEARALARGRK